MRKGWWRTGCLRTGETAFRSPFGGGGVIVTQMGVPRPSSRGSWRAVRLTVTLSPPPASPHLQAPWRLEQDRDTRSRGQVRHAHRGRAHTCLAGEVRHEPCFRNQAEASGQMPQRCQGQETVGRQRPEELLGTYAACAFLNTRAARAFVGSPDLRWRGPLPRPAASPSPFLLTLVQL